MGRAPCCEKVGLKKGRWTAEEDEILTKYILANGEGSWRSLPRNAGLLRCGKSCRLRWINYLRADLKRGNITKEEEETIVKLHTLLGNRWSLIAAQLPGRTDNEVKNYWNSHLSRKIYSFVSYKNGNSPPTITLNIANIAGLCKGRARRSAMKKQNTTLLSVEKPNKSGTIGEVLEPPAKEEVTSIVNPGSQKEGLVTRSPQHELETRRNLGVHGSCIDTIEPKEINAAELCCTSKETEIEVLGPYEWLDSEIKRLEYILQSEVVDPIGGNDINTPENGNFEVLGPEKVTTNDQERESSSNGWSSNAESGERYYCCTPVNSRLDEEWLHLDWTAGGDDGQWEL